MKALCDVHISYKVVRFFRERGIETLHVNELPEKWFTKDRAISQLADREGFTVITKDIDFKNTHFLQKTPARLIRIALGNIPNQTLLHVFEENLPAFEAALENETCCIEILPSHINIVSE